jgi:hypothetical protein
VAEFTLDEDFQFRLTGPGVEAPARGDYFSGTEQRRGKPLYLHIYAQETRYVYLKSTDGLNLTLS